MDQNEHQDFEDIADAYEQEGRAIMGSTEAEMRAAMGDERYDEVLEFQDAVADANLRSLQAQGDLMESKSNFIKALKLVVLAAGAVFVVKSVRGK